MARWTTAELADARQAVTALLEALPLEAYLFEVEPLDDRWKVKLEWADGDAWITSRLCAAHPDLLLSRRQPDVRDTLVEAWRRELGVG